MDDDTQLGGYRPRRVAPVSLDPPSVPDPPVLHPPQPEPPADPVYAVPPDLPSRAPTVGVTVVLGPLGAIPAYLHGREAERQGASSSPYWTAYAVSFAVFVLLWIGVLLAATTVFIGVEDDVAVSAEEAAPAPVVPVAPPVAPPAGAPGPPPPAEPPVWTVPALLPVLSGYADDEVDARAAFSSVVAVTVPCGGEGANGVSPATVDTTSGGALYAASAQVLSSASNAAGELARLRSLVGACGPHDYVSLATGMVLTRCDAPVIASIERVLRYQQTCALEPGIAYAFALFQAGNAVVSLMAPTAAELDAALPSIMAALQAD